MNDTARLAAHRALETEGSTTPAQARSPVIPLISDRPRPWDIGRCFAGGWLVRDANGEIVAEHLSARDAKIIAAAPELAHAAHGYCEDFDRALTRVGL